MCVLCNLGAKNKDIKWIVYHANDVYHKEREILTLRLSVVGIFQVAEERQSSKSIVQIAD
jgi:hypothetical protein